VVPEHLSGANCIDVIIIKDPSKFVPHYLEYLMNSRIAQQQFNAKSEGAAQQHFNVGDAKELEFPLPPKAVQKDIVQQIKSENSDLNTKISILKRYISVLEENQRAVKKAAVTGQIDVGESRGDEIEPSL